MTIFAVLSDVHANVHALEAVLKALQRERVDRFLLLGDFVGWGAHPDACVDRLRQLPHVAVAGNHDLVALGLASPDRCHSQAARRTLAWTSSRLTAPTADYLRSLPLQQSVDGLVLTHGSLADPFEYVRTPQQAAEQLDDLRRDHGGAWLLLHGHTHRAWAVGARQGLLARDTVGTVRLREDERYLLNPGSVGQSRERSAGARFLLLDTERRQVRFRRVRYDMRACREDLRRAGLPVDGCHRPPPSRWRTVRARLRPAAR